MFILYISDNLGLSYVQAGISSTRDGIERILSSYKKDSIRWYIEDDKGFMIDYCDIFKVTLDSLAKPDGEAPTMFATDDQVLAGILRGAGVRVFNSEALFTMFDRGFDKKTILH